MGNPAWLRNEPCIEADQPFNVLVESHANSLPLTAHACNPPKSYSGQTRTLPACQQVTHPASSHSRPGVVRESPKITQRQNNDLGALAGTIPLPRCSCVCNSLICLGRCPGYLMFRRRLDSCRTLLACLVTVKGAAPLPFEAGPAMRALAGR